MTDKTISIDLTIDEINIILAVLSYRSDMPKSDTKVPISVETLIENLLIERSKLERLLYDNR